MPRRWKPESCKALAQRLSQEKAAACAAGSHYAGGWKTDDDGRNYWDCLHGCGHRHRIDPMTPEEITAEEGCQPYRRYTEATARRSTQSPDHQP